MWHLPGLGIEPVSPALAGRFLTIELSGKSCFLFCTILSTTSVGKALISWGRASTGQRAGVEPCLEIMPVSERGAVRGREAAGRRLWEESRREGSTEHQGQGCSGEDLLAREGREGLSMGLQMTPSSMSQQDWGPQRLGWACCPESRPLWQAGPHTATHLANKPTSTERLPACHVPR